MKKYYETYVSPASELYHFGIPGMMWGRKRYQLGDGTWTEEGLERRRAREGFGGGHQVTSISDLTDEELKGVIARLKLENEYKQTLRGGEQKNSNKGGSEDLKTVVNGVVEVTKAVTGKSKNKDKDKGNEKDKSKGKDSRAAYEKAITEASQAGQQIFKEAAKLSDARADRQSQYMKQLYESRLDQAIADMSDAELSAVIKRIGLEKQYKDLVTGGMYVGKKDFSLTLNDVATIVGLVGSIATFSSKFGGMKAAKAVLKGAPTPVKVAGAVAGTVGAAKIVSGIAGKAGYRNDKDLADILKGLNK